MLTKVELEVKQPDVSVTERNTFSFIVVNVVLSTLQ